jgi:hypothetical protein
VNARVVVDPQGRSWRVERRLFPRLGRRRRDLDALDQLDGVGSFADDLTGVFVVVAAIVVIALIIVIVLPLLLLVAEFSVALLLFCWRALLGRWTVVAHTDTERRTWSVRGRRQSAELRNLVAAGLASGTQLPPPSAVETIASANGLTEADVARRPASSRLRVLRRQVRRTPPGV